MATERSNERRRQTQHPQGGQHAATIGDSTLHHKSPWDFSVELQQVGERFDIDSALNTEPQPTADEAALAEFNAALQAAINEQFGGQQF